MEEGLGERRKGRREWTRKGAIVSSSPQGISYNMELEQENLVFSSLKNELLNWHGVKQNAKKCAIGEQNVIN